MKLCSGVKITIIQENGSSKFLAFDRPVRVMELSREESARLGSSLLSDGRLGVAAELRRLIESDFFVQSKSFANIRTELFQKGVEVKAASLNKVLTKMVEKDELTRTGRKGAYKYNKNYIPQKRKQGHA